MSEEFKIYVLNLYAGDINVPALERYLVDSSDVLGYWNYIPLVYCIKSKLSSTTLAVKLAPFFPNGGYMVAEINRQNINGQLPNEAWQWFYAPQRDNWGGEAISNLNWLSPRLLGKE